MPTPISARNTTAPVPLPAFSPRPRQDVDPSAREPIPRIAAAFAGAIGAFVLLGWLLDAPHLRTLGPKTAAAVNPLTAVSFVLAGGALWQLAVGRSTVSRRSVLAIGTLLIVLSATLLISRSWGASTGIDTFLFGDAMRSTGDGRANRMAPNAAFNFLAIGVALVLLTLRGQSSGALARLAVVPVIATAQIALIAHWYRSGWFDSIGSFNQMAFPTALGFTVVALGLLAIRRHTGLMAVWLSDGPGGTLARRVLPVAVVLPVVMGWGVLWTNRSGLVSPDLAPMLSAALTVAAFVIVVSWNANLLHVSHLERLRAEEALRDSEVRFRLLAENGHDIVSLHDLDGRALYVSPSCERILGFTPEEMMRTSPLAMVHPDDQTKLRTHLDSLARGETVTAIATRALHKSGKHVWLETLWRAVLNREGRVVRLQASSRDVTERKGYERELEETRRKLQVGQDRLMEMNQQLQSLASLDALTGMKNRRAFEERLNAEVARARRSGSTLTLLLLDIDHFKQFNDSFGHPRGDEVLRTVARILLRSIRDCDFAARYGGEEFAIILPDTDRDGAMMMGERLREAIEDAAWPDRSITASVGAATFQWEWGTPEALVDHADRALYRSKQSGRNLVTLAA